MESEGSAKDQHSGISSLRAFVLFTYSFVAFVTKFYYLKVFHNVSKFFIRNLFSSKCNSDLVSSITALQSHWMEPKQIVKWNLESKIFTFFFLFPLKLHRRSFCVIFSLSFFSFFFFFFFGDYCRSWSIINH